MISSQDHHDNTTVCQGAVTDSLIHSCADEFILVISEENVEGGEAGGEAKVSVINDAGKLVYQDVQTFAGAGKHFFYFTGEQLPSGKYFYTIESPIGAVIVKKSLLIVK